MSAAAAGAVAVARGARLTVLLTFGLIVLGAVVRATGSGLACPDWPLCHGRLIPPFQTQVLLEWLHRFVALLVSLGTLGVAIRVFASSVLRPRLGGRMVLVIALLASQILLGALTVWKWLHVSVVTLHLGNALLFFAAFIALAERARALAADEAGAAASVGAGAAAGVGAAAVAGEGTRGARGWLVFAAAATFAQILLGGLVSTSHAGLACPDFPGCHGRLFPPLQGLVGLQMTHRYGAFALTALLAFVAWRARGASDVRVAVAAQAALALVGVQILLGVLNVWLTVPVWLSAAHLATATILFAVLVLASLRS
jgi:cytochrome c oxidase assembly protein subunit 15